MLRHYSNLKKKQDQQIKLAINKSLPPNFESPGVIDESENGPLAASGLPIVKP